MEMVRDRAFPPVPGMEAARDRTAGSMIKDGTAQTADLATEVEEALGAELIRR